MIVLDASALLAFLWEEAGAKEVVQGLEPRAVMSSINLTEALTKVTDRGTPLDEILPVVNALNCDIVEFDRDLAIAATCMRGTTRSFGLSLGDRACLAVAAVRALPVLTTDCAWTRLDLGVEVRLIR